MAIKLFRYRRFLTADTVVCAWPWSRSGIGVSLLPTHRRRRTASTSTCRRFSAVSWTLAQRWPRPSTPPSPRSYSTSVACMGIANAIPFCLLLSLSLSLSLCVWRSVDRSLQWPVPARAVTLLSDCRFWRIIKSFETHHNNAHVYVHSNTDERRWRVDGE